MGFPTPVQEEEQTPVSLEGSVEGHSGAESAIFRKETTHAFVCPCLFCSGRPLFPRKVVCQRSKFGLADPREKRTWLRWGGGEQSVLEARPAGPGRNQGDAGWGSPGNFHSPLSILPHTPAPHHHPRTHQGQLGSSERKPPNILESCQGRIPPTKGSACLGEGTPSFPLRAPPERGQRR